MKKSRLSEKFLEELKRVPIVSVVCEKLNLSRQTVYRWQSEDPEFKELFEDALNNGRDAITDLAESKLITEINKGEMRAIEYWLTNNTNRYYKPKKPQVTRVDAYQGVASINIITTRKCKDCGKEETSTDTHDHDVKP